MLASARALRKPSAMAAPNSSERRGEDLVAGFLVVARDAGVGPVLEKAGVQARLEFLGALGFERRRRFQLGARHHAAQPVLRRRVGGALRDARDEERFRQRLRGEVRQRLLSGLPVRDAGLAGPRRGPGRTTTMVCPGWP